MRRTTTKRRRTTTMRTTRRRTMKMRKTTTRTKKRAMTRTKMTRRKTREILGFPERAVDRVPGLDLALPRTQMWLSGRATCRSVPPSRFWTALWVDAARTRGQPSSRTGCLLSTVPTGGSMAVCLLGRTALSPVVPLRRAQMLRAARAILTMSCSSRRAALS